MQSSGSGDPATTAPADGAALAGRPACQWMKRYRVTAWVAPRYVCAQLICVLRVSLQRPCVHLGEWRRWLSGCARGLGWSWRTAHRPPSSSASTPPAATSDDSRAKEERGGGETRGRRGENMVDDAHSMDDTTRTAAAVAAAHRPSARLGSALPSLCRHSQPINQLAPLTRA